MVEKTFKLSETGRAMLMLSATCEDRLIPPPTLPVAAARQVVRSLLNAGMIEEVPALADPADYFWHGPEGRFRHSPPSGTHRPRLQGARFGVKDNSGGRMLLPERRTRDPYQFARHFSRTDILVALLPKFAS